MAARVKKPGEYPDWLFDLEGGGLGRALFPYKVCMWRCTCGAPYFYRQVDKGRHAGPYWRMPDHPEWSPAEGPCWRSHQYGVKCTTPKGARILTHEGYDPPSEAVLAKLTADMRRARRAGKLASGQYKRVTRRGSGVRTKRTVGTGLGIWYRTCSLVSTTEVGSGAEGLTMWQTASGRRCE